MIRDVVLAFARVHVLHHAAESPIFGVGMMEELARHGYRLGPGTMYPLLHRMQADGLLVAKVEVAGGRPRKYYVITRSGRAALARIRPKLAELAEEVVPGEVGRAAPRSRKGNPAAGHGPMDCSTMAREGPKALIERESARPLPTLGGTRPSLTAPPRRRPKRTT